MKNYINYYYNLNANDLVFTKEKYFFYDNKVQYILKKYDGYNIQEYYEQLYNKIRKYKYFFEIVPNKENNLITFIGNTPFILLKRNYSFYDEKISLFDIRTDIFVDSISYSKLQRFPWVSLWQKKIDYLENWIFEKKNVYKKVYPILNYYLGLSENALLYLKETISNEIPEFGDRLSIQHDRLDVNSSLYDYYDPTLLVFDHISRDISEYIKSVGLNEKIEIDLFENYLSQKNLSKYGIMVMYSRILFPTFFYDYFEKNIRKKSSIDVLELEEKINKFQNFLFQVSKMLYGKYGIQYPKWIFN